MAVKKIKPKSVDWKFLTAVLMLVVFGLFILSSASYIVGNNKFNNPKYFLKEQFLKGVLLGMAGFLFLLWLPLKVLKKYSFIFLIFSIGLLSLIFFPKLGLSHGGSTRWLDIGFLSFQPSEILKLSFLIYLASWLDSKQKEVKGFADGLLPIIIIVGFIGLLLLMQPNMGTFGIVALSASVAYFVAGGKVSHLILLGLLGIAAFFLFIYLKPYGAERFDVFLNPQKDPSGSAYQVNQAVFSIGIGGLTGIGASKTLISAYLPEAIGDSIFAVLAEKLGLLGVSFSLFLYSLFAILGFNIAIKSSDYFSKILAVSITSWILIQSFINIAAISGLMPLTGVPLPFMSYGSTGLVVSLVGSGIIANISRYTA